MIIHPMDELGPFFTDVAAGLNHSPKPGDQGHTDDHARLSQVLFDVPHKTMALGNATKTGGSWTLRTNMYGAPDEPATFAEVREFMERPGVLVMDPEGGAIADGETDYTEDASIPDGVSIFAIAAGVVGLAYVVNDLVAQVVELS